MKSKNSPAMKQASCAHVRDDIDVSTRDGNEVLFVGHARKTACDSLVLVVHT